MGRRQAVTENRMRWCEVQMTYDRIDFVVKMYMLARHLGLSSGRSIPMLGCSVWSNLHEALCHSRVSKFSWFTACQSKSFNADPFLYQNTKPTPSLARS